MRPEAFRHPRDCGTACLANVVEARGLSEELAGLCQRAGVHYVFKKGDAWDRIEPLLRSELGVAVED